VEIAPGAAQTPEKEFLWNICDFPTLSFQVVDLSQQPEINIKLPFGNSTKS